MVHVKLKTRTRQVHAKNFDGLQGSGKDLIQPVLDNQLKAASPLVLPAEVRFASCCLLLASNRIDVRNSQVTQHLRPCQQVSAGLSWTVTAAPNHASPFSGQRGQ